MTHPNAALTPHGVNSESGLAMAKALYIWPATGHRPRERHCSVGWGMRTFDVMVVAAVLAVVVAAGFYTLGDWGVANSIFVGALSMVIFLIISVMSRKNVAKARRPQSSGRDPP